MKKEIGIYIHIPFCARKCSYCDFISYEKCNTKIEEYVNALKEEINNCNNDISNYEITTIYIGGGTPSYIDSKYMIQIIETLRNKYKINNNIQITIEVNPGTVDEEKLKTYKKVGINRLSIGLQSTDDELLNKIGRIHNFEQFNNTYNIARKIGFDNISVDLMLALPEQTIESLNKSIDDIICLNPEHISVYSLILEENTKLYDDVETGKIELLEENIERQMYWNVKNRLEEKGYVHYEISNFAKRGYESQHNLNCWNQKEYIGFGLAAHSYFDEKRYSNTEDLEKYIKLEFEPIVHEVQSIEDMQKEYMMLGLRKTDGVKISKFKEKFIQNPTYIFRKELNKLVQEDLIEIDIDYIKLTKKGMDFANLVWEEFV